jgi:Preprotein translocase subunit Sec66
MKRAMADIPLVTHIQKEAPGMNKLYSQSMCSVSQWRAYQNAEALVSAEVDEVRAEADEIEPGWSQVRVLPRTRKCTDACECFRLNLFVVVVLSHSTFGVKPCNITT